MSGTGLDLDAINRRAWKERATIGAYVRLQGWTDPGEQVAVEHVAAQVRSRPILDIGVGAGRTTGILRPVSSDYIGIDYTQEMVQACRAAHPGARIEHMDARDLSAFESGRFALVVFSYNGIDAVDLAGRRQVLREVHRVLQPGGLFLFSAHNRQGPGFGEGPRLRFTFSWNPLKFGWRALQSVRSLARSARNHRRFRALNEPHPDWAVMNCAAHDFGIVIMYTTRLEQERQLQAAGFATELVLSNVDGRPVAQDADTRGITWFHYVARKL